MNTENKYFIIDYGKDVKEYAEIIRRTLEKQKAHIIYIETDCANFLGVEELSEDEFLNYFKSAVNANS
jgi:Ethanolamine utilization protein EutJ (predicted chaperonin)